MQIGFQTASVVVSTFQEFFNARDRASRDGDAGVDGFIGAIEVVPSNGVNIGPDDEVGVTFPGLDLVLLGGAYRARDDLKNVGGRAMVAVLNADGYAQDKLSAELAGRLRGNGSDQAAVDEAARSNIDWLEQTWESAARADRVLEVAVGEDDRLAIIKVGGNDRERDTQIFEILSVENAIDQVAETMVAGETEARNAPAADVAKFEHAACGDDASQRSTAGIRRAENAADAGAGDARNRNAMLLENLQHAEMCEAARKSTAQGDSDACPIGQWGCTALPGLRFTYHGEKYGNPVLRRAIDLAS